MKTIITFAVNTKFDEVGVDLENDLVDNKALQLYDLIYYNGIPTIRQKCVFAACAALKHGKFIVCYHN